MLGTLTDAGFMVYGLGFIRVWGLGLVRPNKLRPRESAWAAWRSGSVQVVAGGSPLVCRSVD